MKTKKKITRKIINASILLALLLIQVIIIQSETFKPESEIAGYLVEVLKVFIYMNLAWLLLLGIRFLTKKKKQNEKK